MKAKFINEMEFNFKKNPTDQFRGGFRKGISRDPVENPRKQRYKLTDEEREIISRHYEKIDKLRNEIDDLDYQIEDLEGDLFNLEDHTDPNELDSFYGDIISQWGEKVLDLLNSGMPFDKKEEELDKMINRGNDQGPREAALLLGTYMQYHPEEPDEKEVEKINSEIKKLKTFKQERENAKEKLETKIYNLETY